MFYLVNLPDALNARLEAASTRAESKFVQDAKRLPGYTTPHIPDQPSPWFAGSAPRRLLINRIVTEVLEVGHAVCVSASKGEVRAHKIGGIVDDILELRCSKLCPDPYRTMGGDRSSGFLSEVRKKLFDSPEWEAHLTETCEVLEAQADEATHAATPASSGAECVFRHEAERWNIRYDGQKWSGKSRLVGLSLIQMLLGSPHNEIRSETLLGRKLEEYRDDPHGPPEQFRPTADTLVDDTSAKQLEEELHEDFSRQGKRIAGGRHSDTGGSKANEPARGGTAVREDFSRQGKRIGPCRGVSFDQQILKDEPHGTTSPG